MTQRQHLAAAIDQLPDEQVERLLEFVRSFARSLQVKPPGLASGRPLLSALTEIQIDGPADFAENLDLYLSGEKELPSGPDLR